MNHQLLIETTPLDFHQLIIKITRDRQFTAFQVNCQS